MKYRSKSNSKAITIIAGIALLFFGVLRGATALSISLYQWGVKNMNAMDMTADVVFKLLIKNPLLVGVRLRGIMGDVYINGKKAGEIHNTYDYKLSGMKSHIVPISVEVFGTDMISVLLSNLQQSLDQDIDVRFDGKVMVGNISIPIDITRNIKELQNDK